jgi:hypothetical protein
MDYEQPIDSYELLIMKYNDTIATLLSKTVNTK